MLRIARAKHRSANVTFVEADAQWLPYPDGSFDVASISFALHEMPASVRGRALHELVRVVRQGGTVLVVDYALPRNGAAATLVSRVVSLYERDCYLEFVRSDVPALLRASGLEPRETRRALLGAAQVIIASRPRHDQLVSSWGRCARGRARPPQ
jgi:SAM-dependent methyltransferase